MRGFFAKSRARGALRAAGVTVFSLLVANLGAGVLTSARTFEGQKLLISGPSAAAVDAANDVARAGGNVADAAVAAALALAVTSPYYASLGGGGFAMVKFGKEGPKVLDFREQAPAATGRDFFASLPAEATTKGGKAIAVPGVMAGLYELHGKYGRLPWRRLFRIPLNLAQSGFQVSGEWSELTQKEAENFTASGRKHFLLDKAKAPRAGEILRQSALAKALELLRDRGPKAFYEGDIAKDIVASAKSAGGVLTLDDLSKYQIHWREPLVAEAWGHQFFVMPPPSSGGIVLATALKLLEGLKVDTQAELSANEAHHLIEVMRLSYRGRSLLGDPDFHVNPVQNLLSADYLSELVKAFRPLKPSSVKPLNETWPAGEREETTHFSVMDADGNAVAWTVSLNGSYGSRVVSERFGVALNNHMDDFTTRPGEPNMFGLIQGAANHVAPGKRPLSSMSPTLVAKDGEIVMSVGAPGGPRIISSVLQVLYRALDRGMDLDLAIQAPRVHHQFLPDKVFVDSRRWSPEVLDNLKSRGHLVETSSQMGKVYAVRRDPKAGPNSRLEAAFDGRGEGAAGGY